MKLPKDDWNAYDCIKGQDSLDCILRDESLGRATRFGFRNEVRPGDEQRVFGVPTIRNDIGKYSQKSVADP